MAQQQKKDGPHLHDLEGTGGDQRGPDGTGRDPRGPEGPDKGADGAASVTQIWDLVRKSTDVIVALREENGILRNELSSLRKSESQLQDRVAEFLDRIETLERNGKSAPPRGRDDSGPQIDRLEDSLKTQPPTTTEDDNTVTITITIKDNRPRLPKNDVGFDDAVRDIVDAVSTAIKTRMTGS